MVHVNSPTSEMRPVVRCVSHDLRTLNKLKNIDCPVCQLLGNVGHELDGEQSKDQWYKQQNTASENMYFYPIREK